MPYSNQREKSLSTRSSELNAAIIFMYISGLLFFRWDLFGDGLPLTNFSAELIFKLMALFFIFFSFRKLINFVKNNNAQ
ncbi:hypothetical protein [uncultured Marinococcus sp.]|uniref:hypothetical protein n=1 Tax=uncultured Marinococcus sp. TaxID=487012 RepID=UPI002628E682|nr:hypothetical protein [uncultured Marinococcus sp.]